MTPKNNTDRMTGRSGPPGRRAMRRNDSTVAQTATSFGGDEL